MTNNVTDANRNKEWIERLAATSNARRVHEQERLIVEVFEVLAEAMQDADLSKADLAKALGVSRAHVTQLFGGQRNATLRTVSDIAWACGVRTAIVTEPLRNGTFINVPISLVSPQNPTIHFFPPAVDAEPRAVEAPCVVLDNQNLAA